MRMASSSSGQANSIASPMIHGLGGAHVLVLIDGIRLNTTLTGTMPGGL